MKRITASFNNSLPNILKAELEVETTSPRAQNFLHVLFSDIDSLLESEIHYGESWYQRDGAGAFFMLARKWDRIEVKLRSDGNFNIIRAVAEDARAEGLIDDIRDLRRYLVLVEAKLIELGVVIPEVDKD